MNKQHYDLIKIEEAFECGIFSSANRDSRHEIITDTSICLYMFTQQTLIRYSSIVV